MTKQTQHKLTKSPAAKERPAKKIVIAGEKKRTSREKTIVIDLGQVPGVPDDGQIGEAIGQLNTADREAWKKLRTLLAEHLGSDAAGRLWLVTASPGFATTPLDEVRQGRAAQLLALLESQWSASPTYA